MEPFPIDYRLFIKNKGGGRSLVHKKLSLPIVRTRMTSAPPALASKAKVVAGYGLTIAYLSH